MNCLERFLNKKFEVNICNFTWIGLEEETDGWKGQRNNKNERWSVVTLPPPRRVHPSFTFEHGVSGLDIAQLWSKVCYLTKPVEPVDKRKKEEIDGCRDAFLAFETDRSGTIDLWELRQVLEVAFFLMYHIIFVAFFFVTIFFFNIGKIPLLFVLIFFFIVPLLYFGFSNGAKANRRGAFSND